jgi:hypothetical protein
VSDHCATCEAGKSGCEDKKRGKPVAHPADVAGLTNKPPPQHPAGQQEEENCAKYQHGNVPAFAGIDSFLSAFGNFCRPDVQILFLMT